ncbi:DUF2937 family protein [Methylobrevis pamukkalensis]|uniref:DUF2937 domain-containing protein n=1 Tax=Methylobrevis pamukkalensis TaxID=1439726 RepID=A0A1E3H7M3_9HYPH|nr:DUF2937 family protein [Methylobrevis pamukkalensis]ODN72338.1 hypothetical protein A6302_00265 [Methylobrevis pamukkalensis]
MLAGLPRILAGVFVAVGFAQSPEFSQQYFQRIGGAIDALRPIAQNFYDAVEAEGADRAAALARLQRDGASVEDAAGRSTVYAVDRYEDLQRQRAAMQDAGPIGRVAALVAYPDPELLSKTWDDFAPAVPTTPAGLAIAAAGFAAGWTGAFAIGRSFRRPRRPEADGVRRGT